MRRHSCAPLIAALMLASCGGRQPADNQTAKPAVAANIAEPAQTALNATTAVQPVAAEQVIGNWVVREDRAPMEADADDICATDYSIYFDEDGSYGDGFQSGRWAASGNELTQTATLDEGDPDNGQPVQKIDPPVVKRSQLVRREGRVLTMREGDHQFWMFRCGDA